MYPRQKKKKWAKIHQSAEVVVTSKSAVATRMTQKNKKRKLTRLLTIIK